MTDSPPLSIDQRIWRRLVPFLADAVDGQPDPPVLEEILAAGADYEVSYEHRDGALWLLAYARVSAGRHRVFAAVHGLNVGLVELDGPRLVYLPDPVLDDDLPPDPIEMA